MYVRVREEDLEDLTIMGSGEILQGMIKPILKLFSFSLPIDQGNRICKLNMII